MSKVYPQAAVFQDEQRHTCIRIKFDRDGVTFIPMSGELKVEKLSHKEFEMAYITNLEDYPVKQAAASYLGATWLGVTQEARTHLEKLSEVPLSSTTHTESKMATAEKKPAKKVEAPKAEKAAKAPAANKVAAPKAAPAKAPKAEKPAGAYDDGAKIKVLNKENPHREGSGRAEAFDSAIACKTAGEYYETGHKPKYLSAWVESGHLTVG